MKLRKSPKYGYSRVLLEHELKCWTFIQKVDSIVLLLPEIEREFMFSILSINVSGIVKSPYIAKEMSISAYQLDKRLKCVVEAWPKGEEG